MAGIIIEVDSNEMKEVKEDEKINTGSGDNISITAEEMTECDTSDNGGIDTELVEEAINKLTKDDVDKVNSSMDPVIEVIEENESGKKTSNAKKTNNEKLTQQEEENIIKMISNHGEEKEPENESLTDTAKNILSKFKDYISGNEFDDKCQEKADKFNVDKAVIKNSFITNVLGTLARVLNLTINTVGNVIISAVQFIDMLITSAVKFTTSTLHKIINVITLNCGNC